MCSNYVEVNVFNLCFFLLRQEEKASHSENMRYLNLAVSGCAHRKRSLSPDKPRAAQKRKTNRDGAEVSAAVSASSLGPHLLLVCRQRDELKQTVPNDGEINTSTSRAASQEDCAVGSESARKRARDCAAQEHETAEAWAEDNKGPGLPLITTNDLLECLVHPDITSRVTELLLERHRGARLSSSPAERSQGTAVKESCGEN